MLQIEEFRRWVIGDGLGISLRTNRRHAITISILHGGNGCSALVRQRIIREVEHLMMAQTNEDFSTSHHRFFEHQSRSIVLQILPDVNIASISVFECSMWGHREPSSYGLVLRTGGFDFDSGCHQRFTKCMRCMCTEKTWFWKFRGLSLAVYLGCWLKRKFPNTSERNQNYEKGRWTVLSSIDKYWSWPPAIVHGPRFPPFALNPIAMQYGDWPPKCVWQQQ